MGVLSSSLSVYYSWKRILLLSILQLNSRPREPYLTFLVPDLTCHNLGQKSSLLLWYTSCSPPLSPCEVHNIPILPAMPPHHKLLFFLRPPRTTPSFAISTELTSTRPSGGGGWSDCGGWLDCGGYCCCYVCCCG